MGSRRHPCRGGTSAPEPAVTVAARDPGPAAMVKQRPCRAPLPRAQRTPPLCPLPPPAPRRSRFRCHYRSPRPRNIARITREQPGRCDAMQCLSIHLHHRSDERVIDIRRQCPAGANTGRQGGIGAFRARTAPSGDWAAPAGLVADGQGRRRQAAQLPRETHGFLPCGSSGKTGSC